MADYRDELVGHAECPRCRKNYRTERRILHPVTGTAVGRQVVHYACGCTPPLREPGEVRTIDAARMAAADEAAKEILARRARRLDTFGGAR